MYTPQLVIDGASHTVGSRRAEIRRAVTAALARPAAARVRLEVGEPAEGGLPVWVEAQVEERVEDLLRSAGGGEPGPRWTLWVALWQNGLVTPVSSGENADVLLHNDRVVRHLERVGEVEARPGASLQGRVDLPLEPDWPASDLGVVAFLQSSDDLRVHGAAGVESVLPSLLPR